MAPEFGPRPGVETTPRGAAPTLSALGVLSPLLRSILRCRARSVPVMLLALFPTGATAAECLYWNLLRTFNAVQANGFNVVFEIDEVMNGKAAGSAHYYTGSNFERVDGKAQVNFFDGQELRLDVFWANKSFGHYTGHIDQTGRLAGITKDLQNPTRGPNPGVYWYSKQQFKCHLEARPADLRPVKKLGKYRPGN
jgi:hypothetical protein